MYFFLPFRSEIGNSSIQKGVLGLYFTLHLFGPFLCAKEGEERLGREKLEACLLSWCDFCSDPPLQNIFCGGKFSRVLSVTSWVREEVLIVQLAPWCRRHSLISFQDLPVRQCLFLPRSPNPGRQDGLLCKVFQVIHNCSPLQPIGSHSPLSS